MLRGAVLLADYNCCGAVGFCTGYTLAEGFSEVWVYYWEQFVTYWEQGLQIDLVIFLVEIFASLQRTRRSP